MHKKKLLQIASQIDNINRTVAILARWSVLVMLGLGFWNVIGRYLGVAIGYNLSSNGLIEGQWYLFDVIFLLGLGWTLQRQGHVRVDVLQSRWSEKKRIKLELVGTLFLLLPFALGVATISIEPTIHSWLIGEVSPDPNGLPRYWIKTLIPISFLFLSLQGIAEGIKNWSKLQDSKLLTQSVNSHKENNIDRN